MSGLFGITRSSSSSRGCVSVHACVPDYVCCGRDGALVAGLSDGVGASSRKQLSVRHRRGNISLHITVNSFIKTHFVCSIVLIVKSAV